MIRNDDPCCTLAFGLQLFILARRAVHGQGEMKRLAGFGETGGGGFEDMIMIVFVPSH